MKKSLTQQFMFLSILVFVLSTNYVNAQTSHGITKIPNSPTNENNYDKPKLYDRFGNEFSIEELRFKRTPSSNPIPTGYPLWLPPPVTMLPCNAGLFNIEFAPEALPTAGFYNVTYRNVVCQVFRDISRLFYNVDTNNTTRVNILVSSEQALPNYFSGSTIPAGIDVVGSGFELVQPSMHNAFIDNTIYTTIRSGKSAYYNLEHFSQYKAYDYFHGYLAVRLNGKNWYTNLTAKNITATQDDLYSAILSEALHMLGLYSQVHHNGNSVIGNNLYSRYDNFLYKNTTATKVLSQSSTSFVITKNVTNLALSCTSPNNVIFNGNSLSNQSVYTSSLWQTGSNLSHFGCNGTTPCNTGNALPSNTYTLIPCRGLGANYFKRYPHLNEVKALCDIGYKLKVDASGFTNYGESDWNDTTYGNIFKSYASCTEPCVAVGKHDTFYKPYYTSFTISFSSILSNDFPSSGIIGRFALLDTNLGTITTNATSFTFTPKLGRYSDRVSFVYYPKCNTSSDLGNASFVTVYYTYTPQLACENIDSPNCNYICTGTFEEVDDPNEWCNFAVLTTSTINTVDLYRYYGSESVYRNHVSNVWQRNMIPGCRRIMDIPPSYKGGNHYVGLEGTKDNSEGIHFKLRKPISNIDTNKKYRIRFQGTIGSPMCPTVPIMIFGGDSIPKSRPNALFDWTPFKCNQSFCPLVASTVISFGLPTWNTYDLPINFGISPDTISDIVVCINLDTIKIDGPDRYAYLDNFEVYEDTRQKVNITTIYPPYYPCSDTLREVKFVVCMKHNTSHNSDTVYVQLNLPAGITVAAGSDFTANGTYTYPPNTILSTVCDTLTLRYAVANYALHFSSMFEIGIGYSTHAYCNEDKSDIFKMYPSNSSLTFLKTASKMYPSMGDTVTFNIQICNPSAIGISGLNLLDQVPSGIKLLNYTGLNLINPNTLQQLFVISPAVSSTQPSCINFSYTGISMSNCRIPTQAELTSIYNPCNTLSSALNLNDTNIGTVPKATISPQNFVWCGSAIPFKVVDSSTTHTYQWYRNDTLISGATSKNYSATSSAQYSVKVSNSGCVTKVETPPFDTTYTVDYVVTDEVCTGGRGSISLSPKRGVPPFNYTWNSSSLNTAIRSNLIAGIYNVTVTDSIGCTKVLSITVGTRYDTLKVVFDSLILPTCTASNGKIYITTTKGTAPYTYLWNDGSALKNRFDIKKSFYKLTVTDTNGCKWVDSFNIENVQDTLVIQDSVKAAICASSSGIAILNTTGGTMPYKYIWTSGDTTSSRVNLIPGNYHITVTDLNGCLKIDSVNVSSIPDSSFKTSDSIGSTLCFANTGAIYLYSLSGTPPYSFSWSSGHNTQNLIDIDSGIYTVIVTDTNGCQLYDTFYVPRLEDPISFNFFNDVNCNLGLATFNIEPTSGYKPHFIWWADGDTSRIRDSMTLGLYTVTVFDSIGCSTTMQVDQSFTNTIILDKYIIQPNCGMSGSIRVEPVTGKAPFTYLWNNGSTDSLRTNLTNGTYLLTVTDSFGCVTKDTITLIDQNPSNMQATIQSTVSCVSGTNSSLKANPAIKTNTYKYLWSTGDTTQSISVANNGQRYTVTITDVSNNCRKSFSEVPHQDSFIKLGTNYNINDYNDALTLGILNSSTLHGYNLVIGGTFTITENIDWKNCDIVLESGASIEFPIGCSVPTDMVIMHNNNIYTCGDQLAKGLSFIDCMGSQTMGSYTDLYLDFKENNVRDCYKGIEIERALFPNLVNNQFVNNMIGIHFNPSDFFVCTPFARLIYLPQNYQQFHGNTFYTELVSGVGKVKKPYSGIQFDEYSHTGYNPLSWINMGVPYGMGYAGLVAEKTAEFNIGNTQQLKNSFENLLNGVLLYGTSTSIVNTTFSDIHYRHLPTSTQTAIRAKGNPNSHLIGKLTVYGYGKTVQSEDMFKNVYSGWGIVLEDLEHAHIEKVKMKDVGAGVTSTVNHSYALNKVFRLKDSRFYGTTPFAHGGLQLNDYTLDNFFAVVDNNEFYDLSATAIRANKATKSFNNSWLYVTNNVMRGNTVHGIDINGYPSVGTQRRVEVRGNNLKFTGNKFYTGIHYYYSQNVLSKENTVKGSLFTYPYPDRNFPKFYPVGIYHNNSTGMHTCNIVDSMYTGTRFFMNCNNTDWKQNKMKNHFQGLNIGSNSSLKQQFKAGNSFTGTCNVEAISNQSNPTQFYVSNSSADYMPNPRSPIAVPWWLFIAPSSTGAETDNCSGIISFPGGGVGVPIGNQGDVIVWRDGIYNPKGQNDQLIYGLELTTIDTAILTNTMTFNSFQPELTWQYRKDLYDKVKPFESELRDTSIFRDYLSQMEDGTINEFTEMNVIEQQSIEEMNASAVQIETLRHVIDSGWRQMVVLDSLVESAVNASQRAQRIQDRNLLTQWIRSQDSQLHVIVFAADSNNSEHIQQVQDIMDTLIPEGLSDSLSQVFHQLYYQTIGQGNSELSQPQYQAYQAIAAQCPFINVEAVYRSRIILLAKGDTSYYNDSLICSVHGITVKSTKPLVYKPKPNTTVTFKVYPNPSSDIIHIQISEVLSKKLRFVINDILGREVYSEIRDMNSNRFSINGSLWQNGVYSLRIIDNDNTVFKAQIQIRK